MKVPTLNDTLRPWWGKLRAGLQYILTRRGPLSLSVNQGGGFFRTSPDLDRPNMQLYMQAFSTLIPKDGERPLLTPDPFSGLSLGGMAQNLAGGLPDMPTGAPPAPGNPRAAGRQVRQSRSHRPVADRHPSD